MTDIVTPDKRSKMMSGIRSTNTKPEVKIRKLLHHHGFRFRLHVKKLSGTPDIVLSRFNAVIFVHGCFWHGHSCNLFKLPSTNTNFWINKISNNQKRDKMVKETLLSTGWRISVIWECSLKGRKHLTDDVIISTLSEWLHGEESFLELTSN